MTVGPLPPILSSRTRGGVSGCRAAADSPTRGSEVAKLGCEDARVRLPRADRVRVGEPGLVGIVRVDRRTKHLTKRLRPAEIAIIDHVDLDRVSAEALVACRPSAVINASPSISGRYPNLGPAILLEAGIPLIDDVGGDLFDFVVEGEVLRLHEGTLYRADAPVAAGRIANPASIEAAMAAARAGLSDELKAFVTNTMEHLEREHTVLLDPIAAPPLRTRLDGRHALIVVRGPQYREDLAALRPYLREYHPVLIGVDGGADALLEAGYTPELIVGDMDSVSDKALSCGAELVVHAYADGRSARDGAPGAGWAAARSRYRRSGQVRTWRCFSRTRPAPSSSSRSVPTRRSSSSSTRAGRAWPARS